MKNKNMFVFACMIFMVSCFSPMEPEPDPCTDEVVDYYDVLYTRPEITCPQANVSDTIALAFFWEGPGRSYQVDVRKIDDYNFISNAPILIPRNDGLYDKLHLVYALDGAVSDCIIGGYSGEIIVFRNTRTGTHYQLTQIVRNICVGDYPGTMAEFRRNCDGTISPADTY